MLVNSDPYCWRLHSNFLGQSPLHLLHDCPTDAQTFRKHRQISLESPVNLHQFPLNSHLSVPLPPPSIRRLRQQRSASETCFFIGFHHHIYCQWIGEREHLYFKGFPYVLILSIYLSIHPSIYNLSCLILSYLILSYLSIHVSMYVSMYLCSFVFVYIYMQLKTLTWTFRTTPIYFPMKMDWFRILQSLCHFFRSLSPLCQAGEARLAHQLTLLANLNPEFIWINNPSVY